MFILTQNYERVFKTTEERFDVVCFTYINDKTLKRKTLVSFEC